MDAAMTPIEDNRAESVRMQQWQNLINSSAAPLQLQKLQRGKLNVVGEHHSESNARRPLERDLARTEVGGEYWTESEFRTRGKKVLEFFTAGSPQDVRAFGDRLDLRMAESLHYVKAGKDAFMRYWGEWITQNQTDEELVPIKAALQDMLVQCKTHLNEAKRLLALTATNEESKGYDQGTVVIMNQISRDLETAIEVFLKYSEIWKTYKLADLIVFRFGTKFGGEFSDLADLLAVYAGNIGGKTRSATSKLRSDGMDAGATAGSGQTGVWKIGYEHVDDIRGKMGEGEEKNYVLIDHDEFNREYKQLPIWVDGKLVPQLGSSGKKTFDEITNEML